MRSHLCYDLPCAHEMPVMKAVAVVVAQNPPIILGKHLQVDVGQAVRHHRSILAPGLFSEQSALPLSLQSENLGPHRLDGRLVYNEVHELWEIEDEE